MLLKVVKFQNHWALRKHSTKINHFQFKQNQLLLLNQLSNIFNRKDNRNHRIRPWLRLTVTSSSFKYFLKEMNNRKRRMFKKKISQKKSPHMLQVCFRYLCAPHPGPRLSVRPGRHQTLDREVLLPARIHPCGQLQVEGHGLKKTFSSFQVLLTFCPQAEVSGWYLELQPSSLCRGILWPGSHTSGEKLATEEHVIYNFLE